MTRRPLGCLSGSGLIAAALAVLLSFGVVLARGGVWFSPGGLNAQTGGTQLGGVSSHAATGGQCAACHTAPWDRTTMAERCLDCHTEIAVELGDPSSLHGVLKDQSAAMGCRPCHKEHGGATASLTSIDPKTFPHDAVGYSLAGHAQLADGRPFGCADCHTETLARFDVATCDTCHRQADASYMQAHVADFGAACLGCHDGVDRYSRQGFDHNRLTFPLTGKHSEAPCSGCHINASTVADLQATPTECVACHQKDDAHKGQFGTDCAACHVTDTWEGATFDHSKSAFPLTGKHGDVACESCHVNQVFKGTPTECVACHQDPAFHLGAFGNACTDCHTTAAWRPARYNRPHTFPINHGESGVSSCQTCHPDRFQAYTCYGCHAHNPAEIQRRHLGEGISDFRNCTQCHATGQREGGGD